LEATEDIKRNSTKTLLDIPKEEFAKRFQQWQKRWAMCEERIPTKCKNIDDLLSIAGVDY